jgi:hypothetical protein
VRKYLSERPARALARRNELHKSATVDSRAGRSGRIFEDEKPLPACLTADSN